MNSVLVWCLALWVTLVLMFLGGVIRNRFQTFKRLFIPASVIAGGIGFAIIRLACRIEAEWFDGSDWIYQASEVLSRWPGWLIAFVFAGMLLVPNSERKSRGRFARVAREGLMVWVIVLGQTMVGLTVTWLVIQPFFVVPNSFGMLIETGFAGGHGTAAAMGQVFKHPSIQLDGGRDLGVFIATCGLVYGLVSGMLWVNLGARKKWLRTPPRSSSMSSLDCTKSQQRQSSSEAEGEASKRSGLFDSIRVFCSKVSLLAISLVLASCLVGVGLHRAATGITESVEGRLAEPVNQSNGEMLRLSGDAIDLLNQEGASDDLSSDAEQDGQAELKKRVSLVAVVGSFPLFIFTLFGGLLVSRMLVLFGSETNVSSESVHRVTGIAMDVLVFAAITTLSLETVQVFLAPLLILLVAGFIWTGFCLVVLSRWMLPKEHWFELGLINYGMSTGTTATGFVLLRLVDPELKSSAAEEYALAAPLSSPFVGGGMITIALPLLVLERVPLGPVCIGLWLVVFLLVVTGTLWGRHR